MKSLFFFLSLALSSSAFASSFCYELLPLQMNEIAGVKLGVKEVPGTVCLHESNGTTKVEFISFNTKQTVALFEASMNKGACRNGRLMAECKYVTLGRGKVLNKEIQSQETLQMTIKLTSLDMTGRPGIQLGKGFITIETESTRNRSLQHPFTFFRMKEQRGPL